MAPTNGARFSFAPQKSQSGQVASVTLTNKGPEDQQAVMSHGLWVRRAASHMVYSQSGQGKPSLSQVHPGKILLEPGTPQRPGGRLSSSVGILGRVLGRHPQLDFSPSCT